MVESTGVNFFTGFNLDEYEVPSDVLALVPREVALRFKLVPLCIVDKTLTITMVGPSNTDAIEDIKLKLQIFLLIKLNEPWTDIIGLVL